ncbi:PTS galactosamine/N-acetylgalactosamine transporter subunit IIA [Neobacillus kokaensis]|uniref:PTS N-acetylgalactosamine transporter subunit IIA n=1 Tax=Neobacillus kokaensis TaxID=2759023 RepID=A0ABQ3N531_9BACI|nr:PTS galactosamine/N-acetylgalactosamine transporter subunit IIA [Neobacillus kokaensis]GHH98622.1 PTS N-acetylgalactosamine transporter subunit IIA [Neobacillus kokaensis]
MIGLILTGHANFASGLTSSLKLIAGEAENYVSIDFLEGMSQENLTEELNHAINQLTGCQSFIILTDIPGGTPYKAAVLLSLNNENIRVISGTNLPLLLQLSLSRLEGTNTEDLVENSIKEANQSLSLFDKNAFQI